VAADRETPWSAAVDAGAIGWQFMGVHRSRFRLWFDASGQFGAEPIKLHQHGFHGCMDTEDSLHDWLERMQKNQLLPR
jgi:hypothetical protein